MVVDKSEAFADGQFPKQLQKFFMSLNGHEHPDIQYFLWFAFLFHALAKLGNAGSGNANGFTTLLSVSGNDG